MIWLFVILTILVLGFLERKWAPYALQFIQVSSQGASLLTQPGERVTWTTTVENHSRLPVPFLRLELRFPNELKSIDDSLSVRGQKRSGIQRWTMEERLSLGAQQSRSRSITLIPQQRGEYHSGGCRLSIGDLLGFQETSLELPAGKLVVMPELAKNNRSIQAVSGFLGDLSVRRFILEDPILTIGFRDYTGREPLKDVSWTRTATTGKLQVKQYDHTAEQSVCILLNTEDASPEEMEAMFRQMRSVCEELERKKVPFSIRTNGCLNGPVGKLFYLSEGLGQQHLNTILYSLGRADYTCYYSFRQLARKALDNRKSNESYLVISPKESSSTNVAIRQLERASGNPVCILYGNWEVAES